MLFSDIDMHVEQHVYSMIMKMCLVYALLKVISEFCNDQMINDQWSMKWLMNSDKWNEQCSEMIMTVHCIWLKKGAVYCYSSRWCRWYCPLGSITEVVGGIDLRINITEVISRNLRRSYNDRPKSHDRWAFHGHSDCSSVMYPGAVG